VTSCPPSGFSRSRWLARLLVAGVLLGGCAAEEALPVSAPGVVTVAPVENLPARPVALSVVLPPADSIEPSELARVRLLVERALGEVGPWKGSVEILEPSDSMAQLGSVELAARRSSDVCVLGVAAPQVVASVRQLYPALRECLLIAVSSDPGVTTAMPGGAATTNPASPMTTTDGPWRSRAPGSLASPPLVVSPLMLALTTRWG
jgi:hypothetical protein